MNPYTVSLVHLHLLYIQNLSAVHKKDCVRSK